VVRPLRLQLQGALYRLVIRASHRQPLFRDDGDKHRFLDLLGRYHAQFGFKLYAFVLMNRSVELLVETPRANLSKMMQCLGTSYTSYFNRRHNRRGTLFEGRYRSYLLDRDNYLAEVTRHIHRIGVKAAAFARLKRIRNHAWSSYGIYLGERSSHLVETRPVLKLFGRLIREQRKRYQEFVEAAKPKKNFSWDELKFQQIVGSPDFVEKVFSSQQSLQNHARTPLSLKEIDVILREVRLSLEADQKSGFMDRRRRALTRHVAMYLMRRQTNLPLHSIGGLLGVKAPAVALAIKNVEELSRRRDFSRKFKRLLQIECYASSERAGDPSLGQETIRDEARTS